LKKDEKDFMETQSFEVKLLIILSPSK
jgi:hypothetical protein